LCNSHSLVLVSAISETTVEVLPRLFKIKYDSGTLEELLYVDMPREYQNASGQIVLDYAKAIQESVFEHLRVVRNGQLRIIFSPDLKVWALINCTWGIFETILLLLTINIIDALIIFVHPRSLDLLLGVLCMPS